jgi:nicotinamide-nucleotide amidase
MRAYIVSIGSELIAGQLTDTNATFLAQDLAAQGIELLHVIQVGDDLPRLVRTLELAVANADLVVCTGGIGPTDDDLTREAIAALAGETPVVDEDAVAAIREFFAKRGLEMPERNAKQAWVIPSATILSNPVGTAPGWLAKIGPTTIVAMPGVPREMYRMWREQALPQIAVQLDGTVYRSANLRTLGIGESAVAELLGELTRRPQPYVGTYAKDDGVHVRITATAHEAVQAEAALAATVDEVRHRLDGYIYAEDDRPLGRVILDRLCASGLTLAVSENGSGGQFGALLLSDPAASAVVLGVVTSAAADESTTAANLARTVMAQFESTTGVGILAVARPTGQGLYEGQIDVSVSGARLGEATFPIRAAFPEIQRRAALHAADVLRRALIEP